MKKTILFLLPIVVFCLFGCRNKDVAVIGGQDGPAKIYISDKTDNTEYSKNPVKILKIDGNLYYETNKFSEADGRCGNADGSFKKTADEFEIPKNNGESNFSEADSYQVGIEENTLEIRMDNGWKVFEKIDTNSDISGYKYCCVLTGRMNNAESYSSLLVLANSKDITFNDASYVLFGSDTEKMKDIYVLPVS